MVKHIDARAEPRFTDTPWDKAPFDADLIRKIKDSGGANMTVLTKVQKHMYESAGDGNVYAVAATGSGKTVTFMAPIVDAMKRGALHSVLLLSITNALKNQHVGVATKLAGDVASVFRVEGDMGGRIRAAQHAVVVATPAAVLKMAKAPEFATWLAENVGVVVVDEVDGLMEDPMKKIEITKVAALCKTARIQAFTATHSEPSLAWMHGVNGKDLVHIDASDADATNHVHQQWTVRSQDVLPALDAILKAETATPKIMIFFNTNMFAEFAHNYLTLAGHKDLYRMHSRMGSSGKLTRAQNDFSACTRCIVLCSDVAARGMDFPQVSLVIQVGFTPVDKYLQRIGRSGRGTQAGRGVLLLNEAEAPRTLKPIASGSSADVVPYTAARLEPNAVRAQIPSSSKAYKSLFGSYTALKMSVAEIDAVVRPMFEGAGQDMSSMEAPKAKGGKRGGGAHDKDERTVLRAAAGLMVAATLMVSMMPR